MTLNAEALRAHRFAEVRQTYVRRDTILYALGLGLGADPTDEADLDYLLETRARVVPSFAVTLASPGMWIRDPAFGVDFAKLVHAEQEAVFHRSLPSEATVVATPRIAGLYDRGEGKGAILVVERTVRDLTSDEAYATIRQTLMLRGDGGFGGTAPSAAAPMAQGGAPDLVREIATSRRAALIYRLSGDWNPLHSEPAAAAKAGFDRPILHGLASYGMAATLFGRLDERPLESLGCRFSGVVMPGDGLTFRAWRQSENDYAFEAFVGERKVLDRGTARFAG